VRQCLQRQGKDVVVGMARDMREALEQVKTLRPELVIMDLQMPFLDEFRTSAPMQCHGAPRIILMALHERQYDRSTPGRAKAAT